MCQTSDICVLSLQICFRIAYAHSNSDAVALTTNDEAKSNVLGAAGENGLNVNAEGGPGTKFNKAIFCQRFFGTRK